MSRTSVPEVARSPGVDSASERMDAPASQCHVSSKDGTGETDFSRETVERLLAKGEFFWLDLYQPQAADFDVLRNVFKFHPLAVEDSETFHQRAKIDDYDDFVFIVVYGASSDDDRLVEVHCFYSDRFLITIHRDDFPDFVELRHRYDELHKPVERPSLLLYRVLDGLINSFFPILATFDD